MSPVLRCVAFPHGIPEAIINNDVDHRQPVDGDRGITFKPRTGAEDLVNKYVPAIFARQERRT